MRRGSVSGAAAGAERALDGPGCFFRFFFRFFFTHFLFFSLFPFLHLPVGDHPPVGDLGLLANRALSGVDLRAAKRARGTLVPALGLCPYTNSFPEARAIAR